MTSSQLPFTDGKILYNIPERDEPCETYYKIYGDLRTSVQPIVVLHGGPGSGHEYLEPYCRLWREHSIPVVFYDQIGCAKSTHFREKRGDKRFWQFNLFISELQNLLHVLGIDRGDGPGFSLFGHSWGAVLAVAYVAGCQPSNLHRLVLCGGPADFTLLKKNLWKIKDALPEVHSRAIDEAVQRDDFTGAAYANAMESFARTYTCLADPWPPEVLEHVKNQTDDSTVFESLLGRSPFVLDGMLGGYSSVPLLPKIRVPTLVISGEHDTARDDCIEKFVDNIPKVRWVKFAGASHMLHLDSEEMQDGVMNLVGGFLQTKN